LFTSQLHILEDKIDNVYVHGVSGMNDSDIAQGRPYGGCAILWRDSLKCKVTPISINNKRLCMVRVQFDMYCFLLCTIYMPCDTDYDQSNIAVYNDVLFDLLNAVNNEEVDFVICGGDFNTDISRARSLHTKAWLEFANNEHLSIVNSAGINYTYESMSNGSTSVIDHFLVSSNLLDFKHYINIKHDINNISDHSVVCFNVDICIQNIHVLVNDQAKIMWALATDYR
jgi:exonuclease III